MKSVEFIGHQGDVNLFKIDEFPTGEKSNDDQTKKGILAYGELTGHAHVLEPETEEDCRAFRVAGFENVIFLDVRRATRLRHGRVEGFTGLEPDQDYHQAVVIPPGKYMTGIVQETDWLERTTRKVAD